MSKKESHLLSHAGFDVGTFNIHPAEGNSVGAYATFTLSKEAERRLAQHPRHSSLYNWQHQQLVKSLAEALKGIGTDSVNVSKVVRNCSLSEKRTEQNQRKLRNPDDIRNHLMLLQAFELLNLATITEEKIDS